MKIKLSAQTQKNQQEKHNRKIKNKGFIRANFVSSFAALPAGIAIKGVLKGAKKISQLSHDDSVILRKAAQEGLKQTGLYDKGVRAYTFKEVKFPKMKDIISNISNAFRNTGLNDENLNPSSLIDNLLPVKYGKKDAKALGAIKEDMKSSRRFKKALSTVQNQPEQIKQTFEQKNNFMINVMSKIQAIVFKTGNNACYLPNANKILTPDKTLQTSIFHEMGHALNNNGGRAMKLLQKARPLAKIVPSLILTVSLLNKRKTTDEKSESKVQNFFDTIKKNAGKLTLLAMLPMVTEEGIASLRGGKIAKNLMKQGKLSKGILNKVRLTNTFGFATYAIGALSAAFVAKCAVHTKDKIQAKYEAKYEAKQVKKQAKLEKKKRMVD